MSDDEAEAQFRVLMNDLSRGRDFPPNQLFHNLELLIGHARDWKAKSLEQRVELEMALAAYEENIAEWARVNGIRIPGLNRADTSDLKELETLWRRREIAESVAHNQDMVRRLSEAGQLVEGLYHAYEELLYYDRRVDPEIREELVNSLRPRIEQKLIRSVSKGGGSDSFHATQFLLQEPRSMEDAVKPMLQAGESKGTELAQVTPQLIETYVRSYLTLGFVFSAISNRIALEARKREQLEARLEACGGRLTAVEAQHLETFIAGRNPDYNIGRHLANLDALRVEGAKYLGDHGGASDG